MDCWRPAEVANAYLQRPVRTNLQVGSKPLPNLTRCRFAVCSCPSRTTNVLAEYN